MASLLAVDAGNSATKVGLFRGKALRLRRVFPTSDTSGRAVRAVLAEAQRRLSGGAGAELQVAVCSVVPAAERQWRDAARRAGAALFVLRGTTPSPLRNRYGARSRLGPDRLAAAVAAAQCHLPVIVVNLGTATTVDAVAAQGEFLGGAICPGVGVGLEALTAATALLPRVFPGRPTAAVGRDPRGCLRAGAYYGTIGQVNEIVRRQREIVGRAAVVVTGGYARLVAGEIAGRILVRPNLTLEGIRLIWEHNRKGGRQ